MRRAHGRLLFCLPGRDCRRNWAFDDNVLVDGTVKMEDFYSWKDVVVVLGFLVLMAIIVWRST